MSTKNKKIKFILSLILTLCLSLVLGNTKVKAATYQSRTADSILAWALNDSTIAHNSYYAVTANGVTYNMHTFVYNGNQTWASNMTFGDAGDVGTASTNAQNMVVVIVNGDLTINSGVTVQPYYSSYGGPKGFTLVVNGTLTNNGVIANDHGAKAGGQNVYLWKNVNGTYEYVPASGSGGGASRKAGNSVSSVLAGVAGTAGGGNRRTGGGGSGGSVWAGVSGAGGTGTSYSGGAGGGGAYDKKTAGAGSSAGGAGGAGACGSDYTTGCGGGAGNPGGAASGNGSKQAGTAGTGGLITILALDFNNNGTLRAIGAKGGNGYRAGGGGSGGGSINVFATKFTKTGSVNVAGGALGSGTRGSSERVNGAAGGAGTYAFTTLILDEEYLHPSLSTLTVDKGTLNPTFDPKTKSYYVALNPDDDVVNINATLTNPENTITSGVGEFNIPAGNSIHKVTITSKIGVVESYNIEFYRPPSSYRYLKDIQIDGTSITGFQPTNLTYNITLPYSSDDIELKGVPGKTSQDIFGDGAITTKSGNNQFIITVVSEDGQYTTYYTINVYREHSSKLKSLKLGDYTYTPDFDPETNTYNVTIMSTALALSVTATPYDEEATYKLSGFGYIKNSQTGTITVTEPNSTPTTYTVNITKEGKPAKTVYTYGYTGKYQTFIAPATGFYKIEAWGAQGGNAVGNNSKTCSYSRGKAYGNGCGGFGAYTSGTIKLNKDDVLYIYVGQRGLDGKARNNRAGGWNGGGSSTYDHSDDEASGSGGGATDIRLVATSATNVWNEFASLKSRIMVAAGGGGGSDVYVGGNGGTLQSTKTRFSNIATQTSGYAFGYGENSVYRKSNIDVAGGGAGYFGGYSTAASSGSYGSYGQTGTGGSSFVSGCTGCRAITETSTSQSNKSFKTTGEHYSGYVFDDIVMIGGGSTMPNSSNGYSVGNSSNGYARITMINKSENNFLSSITVKATDTVEEITTTKTYQPQYDMEVEDYYVDFDSNETQITLSARPEDSTAKIEGLGDFAVPAGPDNVYEIKVTAEAGNIKTYRIHVNRPADDNPYPKDIVISGLVPSLCTRTEGDFCKLAPATFDPLTNTYELTVPSRIKQLWFDVEKGHPYQEVDGEGKVSLEGGENIIQITVISEAGHLDGTNTPATTYFYKVTRDMTGNNDLDVFHILDSGPKTIKNGSGNNVTTYDYDLHFDPDTLEYYLTIPNNYEDYLDLATDARDESVTDKLQMYIETSDPNATYSIDPENPAEFNTGMNDLKVKVTAANGEEKTYILHIYREQSKNTYLSNIQVKNGTTVYPLAPLFNKGNTGTYQVTVPNDITNVDIIATPDVSTTTVEVRTNGVLCTGSSCNNLLNTGNNKVVIKTTAENSAVTETYTLNIFREKNNNAYLSNLQAFIGETEQTLNPTPFDKDTFDYAVELPIGTTTISLKGTPEKSTTQVKYLDNNTIKVGTNVKRIMTIAEDGTSLIYRVTFTRPADTNNYLKDIQLSTGTLDPFNDPFDKTIEDYTIEVENNVTSITVTGIKENALSTVKGNGKYSLVVGENEIVLTVTSESGISRNYNLKVTRKPNSNAYLTNITTTEGITVTTHDTLDYVINIGANVNKVTLLPVAEVKTTTVTPSSSVITTPTFGDYPITYTTLAEDGVTSLTYNIIVRKAKSSNNFATSIIMEEGAMKPSFNKNTPNYNVKVARDVTSGTFHVTLEDPRSTYTITGNESFEIGDNTVIITVTAEDGTERNYTVVVTRQELTSNYLLDIKVKGLATYTDYELEDYNKEKQYYEINVPYGETQVNVSATLEDVDAEVKGTGIYNLNVGDNIIVLEVTSLDGKSRTYQIKINRAASNDARLSAVTINGALITPSFNKDVFSYNVETTNTSLNFTKIVPIEKDATYEIIGNSFTTNEAHEVIIRVTAPDKETTQDYTFNVTKAPSDNNNLASLKVLDFEISPTFAKNKTIYTLTVPKDTNNIIVEAIPEHELATVTGDGAYTLTTGTNEITVEVTSESGKKKSYVIIVTKEGSDNNLLDSLVVTNGVMDPAFDGRDTYNVTVPYSEESLDIEVILQDDTASYVIENNTLKVGSNNQVRVVVTAENGSKKTYKLNVTREDIVSPLLKTLKFEGYELSPAFNGNITNYNLTIDNEINEFIDIKNYTQADKNDISKRSVTIETLDKNATYTISGNDNLQVGNNTITIVVTSSDGTTTETYTVNVNKQAYSNTFLDYLYTNKGDVSPLFDKYISEYTINVANDVTQIELYAEAVDGSAKVVGACNPLDSDPCTPYNLKVGATRIPITVTTTSNMKRTYYVTVNRAASDLNYLETLNVKVGGVNKDLTPEFIKTTNTYTLDVPVGTTSINLTGTISPNATVTGLGNINIQGGTNTLYITVTSESGIPNVYTLTVNRPKSDNNYLIEIVPSIGELEPSFSYEETNYTINLDSSAAFLSFDVIIEDFNATATGMESKVVPDGTSTRTIVVTAENGDERTYTFTINKERTDISTLSNLYVTGYPFEDGTFEGTTYTSTFDPDTYSYHITVPYSKKVLLPSEVVATTTDPNAKITKSSNLNLITTSENVFTVTVTAPDGFTKTDYKIYITREKNNEALLTKLVVNVGHLTAPFNPTVLTYDWKIPKGSVITDASVTAIASDPNATIVKTDRLDMGDPEPHIFYVMITSEDGKTSVIYQLNVSYDLSIDTTLGNLIIDKGYYIPTFNPDIRTYHAYEYVDETSVTVTATPNAPTSTVTSGNGIVPLIDEITNHVIEVQAEDGSIDYYYLIIHKSIFRDEGLLKLGLNGLDGLDCVGDRCELDPLFDTDITDYNIKVPYEYTKLNVLVETQNDQQTYKLKIGDSYIENGKYDLPIGKTKVLVEVYDGMGVLTRTYTMNVERCNSNNNYLKSLSVVDYTIDPSFDKTLMEYTIYVENGVNEVEVLAEPEDPQATVHINGYNYLEEGNNDVTVEVVARDGSVRTYIVHVIKAPKFNNYLKNITVSTGVFWPLTPKFKSTIHEYTVTVPSTAAKATVDAVAVSGEDTIITGTGEYDLKTGVNVVKIKSKSKLGGEEATYTVTIIREESANVNIASLIVEEGSLNPTFTKENTRYEVSVPYNVDKLTMHITLEDPTSKYTVLGNQKLKTGDNTVSILVTNSTNTATKTYQITVHKAADTRATLGGLRVYDDNKNYTLTPSYAPSVPYYNVEVPHDVEKVTIEATTTSDKAVIVGDGLVYLDYGINQKRLTITSESGDTNIVTVEIYRNYNLNLKTLMSDKGTMYQTGTDPKEETFSPNVTNYTIELDKDTDKIVFIAIPESNKVIAQGSGEYILAPGDNIIEFKVISPDNHEKVYKVNVIRAKDTNNYLAELQVKGLLTPVFDKETNTYTVDVRQIIEEQEITKLGINKVKLESKTATCVITGPAEILSALATDNDCTLQSTGTLSGLDQKNEVKIKVTAQSGAEREYTLNVYRRNSDYFSNRITSLTITTEIAGTMTDVRYNPDFDPYINNYAATVANSITSVNVQFIREDDRSTYEIILNGISYGTYGNNLPLNPGRNIINIFVTSSDGLSTNVYSVVIYRTESSDATLKYLETTGFNYSPLFGKETTEYTLSVSGLVTSIPVVAVPTDPNAKVTISGNTLLQPGENIITIHVAAPDGITTKDYKIKVTKQLSINDFLTMLEVVDHPFNKPFDKNDYGPYIVNVTSDVTNILIRATSEDPNATITGDGAFNLTTGENIFPVDVEAEDPDYTRTYTIIVNKAASSDSTLKEIILSDGELDPVFAPGTTYYEVLVPEELEEITITGIPNAATSTVTGNDTYGISDIETTIILEVKAEDGSKTPYTIKVIRDIQSVSTLKSLIVKSGELYPRFHRLITSYTVLVPNEVRSFSMDSDPHNMIYVPDDPNATITVSGNTNFRVGANKVKISVTSSDGNSTTDYEISVIRQAVASNYLRSLEVRSEDELISYKLNPTFVKDTLYYETTVPMDVETVRLKAVLEDFTATVSGAGTKHLEPGENRFYVTVESAGGIIRSYQIVINRTENSENFLLTLTHDVGELSPSPFDKETNNYTITVPEKTPQITLDGTISENATVVGLGTFQVAAGEQTRTITVVSQSGEANIYNIKIVRPASTNTNLTKLIPNAGVLKYDNNGTEAEGYTNDVTEYYMDVNDSVSIITFEAATEDEAAVVTGTQLTTLEYGENEIKVIVTAEDGITTREITIKINRSKSLIGIIASEEKVILGVGEDITVNYTLDPPDATNIAIEWVSADPTIATVDQDGKITGVKIGTTEITVRSATDNNIYDTIIVNVISKLILSDIYDINRYTEENILSESGLTRENHVIGLEPATTLSDFISKFKNEPETLYVYDAEGNEVTDPDAFIATSMKITLMIDNVTFDELKIVVRGDVNGDAFIDVSDYDMLNQYLLTLYDFSFIQNTAGDIDKDEFITVSDYDVLNQYLLLLLDTVN